jgi:polar amino acid transport system substrate-binding protein
MNRRISFALLIFAVCFTFSFLAWRAQAAPSAQTQPLRVVTKTLPPLAFEQDGAWTGFSVELWQAIATDLGLDYQWVQVETVDQQLEAVADGSAEAAISGISMTPEREALVDFSYPYFDAGLQIIIPANANTTVETAVRLIFSPLIFKILGLGLLILLVIAHIIWLSERGTNDAMPTAYLPGIWEASWWALSTLATYDYGDGQKPKSAVKRLLAMFLVVLGIFLIAQFTAVITASVTVEQLTRTIEGPADLPGKQIATVVGTTSAQYLERENLSYTGVTSIDEAYALLESGEVEAVVYDAPVLLYYAHHEGRGKVQLAGSIFEDESYGIALPTGSPLREAINNSLLRLKENGTYDEIYAHWFEVEE